MLGLLLVYWLGKRFYQLAEDHDQSKWGYAILGVVSYYIGTIIFGIILGVVCEIFWPGFVTSNNEFVLGLLTIPFGVLLWYLVLRYFEKKWKNLKQTEIEEIDNIGIRRE